MVDYPTATFVQHRTTADWQ